MLKHPLIERYFPELPKHKLDELAGNIQKDKQKLPIIMYQGKILDGWNRWRAMRSLGWTQQQMKFTEFKGTEEEAIAFVFNLNFYRRHLPSSELDTIMQLMLSARHAEMAKVGRPPKDQTQVTQAEVAEVAGVSERTLRRRRAKFKNAGKPDICPDKDPFGHELTPAALGYWLRKSEVQELVKLARQLALKIKGLNKDDPMWTKLSLQALEAKANAIAFDFDSSMPYCLCVTCLGIDPENCRLCNGRGVITKHIYDTGVPKETKETFEETTIEDATFGDL